MHATTTKLLLVFVSAFMLIISHASSIRFHYINSHNFTTKTSASSSSPSSSSARRSRNPSLALVHRDAITGAKYPSRRHAALDLVARDNARAEYLVRRLNPTYLPTDLGSEVVSGLDQGSGEYFVRVGVGSPPTEQYLVVDSGSDVIWVQCKPCLQCYAQADPLFDPASSSTFSGVSCGSAICRMLSRSGCGDSGRCQYEVSYGDGSYTKGVLALETLTVGGTAVEGVAIGCGHRNHGLFVGASGLLGLGWGPMSLVGQLGGAAGGAFSYCLASRGPGSNADAGSLVLGRSEAVPEGAVWVPLVRNPQAPSFYYVSLTGIGVGDEKLPLEAGLFQLTDDGAGGVVMDTGTAVSRLPQEAYAALRDAFASAVAALPRAPGVSLLDTCYDLSGYTSVRVPTVSFYFDEGATLTLPARNLLVEVDGGIYCLAFAASSSGLSILGNIQQEGIQITVDSANGFIGFGPNTC
ncbi:Protein ASPARTIC PROTEASE IN GUARD CELL 2 [Dichanthelium oligosanthes]|uniref:Protein ASPARTIC PROTEASE IN GUARD CELL 2 n=1 Tax=Dichanthelium oligosanthes TaxID=888268 RepID=A0A1E5VB78_9POAL|nr:Protein ASPARTIC PROTEASE IN GUARD CELL 2 [Dichanthelium oligosanthes]